GPAGAGFCRRSLDALKQPLRVESAAIFTVGSQLFGNRRHAVVSAQREHVLIRTNEGVESVEQRADGDVQMRVHVANFLCAWTKLMSDELRDRKAAGQDIGRVVLSKPHRLHESRGHPAKI